MCLLFSSLVTNRYSLYEFEEPFLDQSFDLRLTFDLPDVGTQDVLTRLDLKQNIKFLKQKR